MLHLDLKSANVLLDKHFQVAKIADLGISRYMATGSLLTWDGRPCGARPDPALSSSTIHTGLHHVA